MVVSGKIVFVLVVFEALYMAAVDGLQCPDCTYMTTNVQVPLLKDIIQKIIDTFSDPVCSAEIVDPNTSGIKYQTCARPASDSVSKCRHYRGQVTVKALGQELILNTFERGCYEETISYMPLDGCFQRTSDPRDKSFFQTVIDQFSTFFIKMDVVNFSGKMCICSSTEFDCKNTSGSQGVVLSTVILIVSFVSYFFMI
ncbi:hypothetical protein ACJMK2_007473 [Sinanodonta woodiana]|uniref:Uncharacterized protein n=1 Tax=Sinanodonta woodiana TaxID=1069815 RepID=A0ABD3VIN2_SINWO